MKKNEDNIKDFPHPIDEWTTQKIPFEKKEFNPDTGTFETTTSEKVLKVKYLHIPKEKYRCKDGEHVYRVLDKSKYIFGCIKCQYSRIIYPGTKGLNIK